jgi:hypothetical protein
MPRFRSTLIALLVLAAVAPAGAAAASPQPPDCPLYAPRDSVEHPLTLPDGSKVVARDPYGGQLARNRLFFDFSLSKPGRGGTPAGVAQVTWALDGKVVRTDPKPPFEWKGVSGSDRRMPAGDHQITVAVTPAGGGAAVSTTFALTATDCQPASANAFVDEDIRTSQSRTHGSVLYASSAFEGGEGPTMSSFAFLGQGVSAHIPAAARGRAAGTLHLDVGGRAGRTYTLRVPRTGSTLLRRNALRVVLHPGARRFLTVIGLPAGVREATMQLIGRGGGGLLRTHHTGPRTCHYSTAAVIGAAGGASVRVTGDTVSGHCARL